MGETVKTIHFCCVIIAAALFAGGCASDQDAVEDSAETAEELIETSETQVSLEEVSEGKVYLANSPIGVRMEMNGWSYEIEIAQIQGIDFGVSVENFPPPYAGLSVRFGGETIAEINSLDTGRNAPSVGTYQVVYKWSDAPQSEKQSIPPIVDDPDSLLGFRDEYYYGGSCSIYVTGQDVQCVLQNVDWLKDVQTPGLYSLGEGFIGESGKDVRMAESQVEELARFLNDNPPGLIQIVLKDPEGQSCFLEIDPVTLQVSSGEYSECSLTQFQPN